MHTSVSPAHILPLLERLGSIEGIRYVALDQGQLEQDMIAGTGRPPIVCPAILVDIQSETIDHLKDRDRASVSMRLRLITDTSLIANYAAPDAHKKAVLEPYDLVSKTVDAVLQGQLGQWLHYERLDKGIRLGSLSELTLSFSGLCSLYS